MIDLDAVDAHLTYAADTTRLDGDRAAARHWLIEAMPDLAEEVERLRQHILDIDAHATPYGDIPEEPGYVGTYLVTAGALHRALGTIGHTAPKCEAEAEADRLRKELAARDDVDALLIVMRSIAEEVHRELTQAALRAAPTTVDEHAEQAIAAISGFAGTLTPEEFADLERKFSAATGPVPVTLTDEQADRLVRDIKDGAK